MSWFRLAMLGCAVCLPARAQTVVGPYISLGAGADLLQNENFRPTNGLVPLPRSYRFDVGPAGVVSLGYGVGHGLRFEVEGDYAYNHVRGVTFSQPLHAGGHEQQYGGFVNAIQDFALPPAVPVTPYFGIGAGYRELELDDVASGPASSVSHSGMESRGNFAYQGIAGVATPLPFVPGLSLTAEYRLIGMLPPSDYPRYVAGYEGPLRVSVNNVFNHEALIGLRLAFGVPRPAPPPMPVAASVPAPEAARTYLVFFDWDRADLTARARTIIADAAQASNRVQTTRIEVDGYTDLSGTLAYNAALSVRRADAVAAELVRDGVSRGEITTEGFGETRPLVPTAQGVREPQNRRVEIILK